MFHCIPLCSAVFTGFLPVVLTRCSECSGARYRTPGLMSAYSARRNSSVPRSDPECGFARGAESHAEEQATRAFRPIVQARAHSVRTSRPQPTTPCAHSPSLAAAAAAGGRLAQPQPHVWLPLPHQHGRGPRRRVRRTPFVSLRVGQMAVGGLRHQDTHKRPSDRLLCAKACPGWNSSCLWR